MQKLMTVQSLGPAQMSQSITMRGNAMSPVINGGDHIAIRPVPMDMVLFGEMYYIVFKETGIEPVPIVRYIQKGPTNDFWTLRSANNHYQDTDIPIKSIKAVFKVSGAIKHIA